MLISVAILSFIVAGLFAFYQTLEYQLAEI